MITQAQLDAESITPALTDNQVMALTLLVRRYPAYFTYPGRYPSFEDKLATEQATPTINTVALKAVLTALDVLPSLVVESQGTPDSQSFFSTVQNWQELAQDVLDIFYAVPVVTGAQSYALAQRKTEKMALKDRVILKPNETGRRW